MKMENAPDAEVLMNSAWEARRRFLSASKDKQEALIQDARRNLVRAVAICRNEGDPPKLAQAIHLLANVERDMGREESARELWKEAVSICRSVGDELQLAHKVRHLGDIYLQLGRPGEAETCYEEALALYRGHVDPPSLDFANVLARMAALKEHTGATGEALGLWKQARDLYETAGIAKGVEDCAKSVARLTG